MAINRREFLKKFDKQKVIEEILKDIPVKMNIRKEIKYRGPGKAEEFEQDAKKAGVSQRVIDRFIHEMPLSNEKELEKKVVLYAFYCNRGVEDPRLKYDRFKNPIPTSPESYIGELYTGGGPFNQEIVEEQIEREKKTKLDKTFGLDSKIFNSAPHPYFNKHGVFIHPAESAREGYDMWDVSRQGTWFKRHFNEVCEKLGYNVAIDGSYVTRKHEVLVEKGGETNPDTIILKSGFRGSFDSFDYRLSDVMDSIEKGWNKSLVDFEEKSKVRIYSK